MTTQRTLCDTNEMLRKGANVSNSQGQMMKTTAKLTDMCRLWTKKTHRKGGKPNE